MSLNKVLVALVGFASAAVNAAPTAAAPVKPRPFALSCNDIQYVPTDGVDGWLTASCQSGEGSTTLVKSAVYVKNKINVNNDAKALQWKPKGSTEDLYCNFCTIRYESLLHCRMCADNKKPVNYFPSQINLAEHIANYAGHLLSDLAGPPTIPTNNPVDVPPVLTYRLDVGGLSTNTSDQTCGDLYGEKMLFAPRPVERVSCLTNSKWTFERLSFVGSAGAWGVEVFDNPRCEGEPFQKVTETETCVGLEREAVAVRVSMLWNGDVSGGPA